MEKTTGLIYDNGYPYPSEDELKNIFAVSCVESVAARLNSSTGEIWLRMNKVNLVDKYIYPCYESLHSESRKNVTDDIISTLEAWEKKEAELC